MDHVYAVIMAGGVGSRFWPASRAETPKQLLDLTGSGHTMIAATVERLQPDIPPERVIVVTGEITVEAVARALPDIPKKNILAEPIGRNTAPCIGWAAVHVKQRDPNGILAVMPSDHLVADPQSFLAAVRIASSAAAAGAMVTFGIKPNAPETGFGYIEMGAETGPGIRTAERFVEKPDVTTAQKYLEAGNFAWNSGMFFFTAEKILSEIETQMPDLKAGLDQIADGLAQNAESPVLKKVFPTLPSESIDYGIMENAAGILCVPVDFGWSDLGSWAAAYELSPKDDNQNAVDGDVITVNSTGCLIRTPKEKLVALVGVDDLIVVDTGDSLMICKKDKAQDVKKVVTALKDSDRNNLL